MDVAVHELTQAFQALANENRLAIFQYICSVKSSCSASDDCCTDKTMDVCVSEIAKEFNLAQSTVSHHLKELKVAGLILTEKRGSWVYCSINREKIISVINFLNKAV